MSTDKLATLMIELDLDDGPLRASLDKLKRLASLNEEFPLLKGQKRLSFPSKFKLPQRLLDTFDPEPREFIPA